MSCCLSSNGATPGPCKAGPGGSVPEATITAFIGDLVIALVLIGLLGTTKEETDALIDGAWLGGVWAIDCPCRFVVSFFGNQAGERNYPRMRGRKGC